MPGPGRKSPRRRPSVSRSCRTPSSVRLPPWKRSVRRLSSGAPLSCARCRRLLMRRSGAVSARHRSSVQRPPLRRASSRQRALLRRPRSRPNRLKLMLLGRRLPGPRAQQPRRPGSAMTSGRRSAARSRMPRPSTGTGRRSCRRSSRPCVRKSWAHAPTPRRPCRRRQPKPRRPGRSFSAFRLRRTRRLLSRRLPWQRPFQNTKARSQSSRPGTRPMWPSWKRPSAACPRRLRRRVLSCKLRLQTRRLLYRPRLPRLRPCASRSRMPMRGQRRF
mmetsp:Transcript_11164/g.34904  ORF Transcript_11164/g.34904 Transcript_11164/m.34904 type:complete len:274 (-) Transcript_11164:1018-1839(-)